MDQKLRSSQIKMNFYSFYVIHIHPEYVHIHFVVQSPDFLGDFFDEYPNNTFSICMVRSDVLNYFRSRPREVASQNKPNLEWLILSLNPPRLSGCSISLSLSQTTMVQRDDPM
jgi:hypothetical protein